MTRKIKIRPAIINVTRFASTIGNTSARRPYNNHRKTPVMKIRYIGNEILCKESDFHARINCGKKAKVVSVAAA